MRPPSITVLVAFVLAAAACGQSEAASSPPATVPEQVQAMWRETTPWVEAGPPEPLLVPGPDMPASVTVTAIVRPESFAFGVPAVPESTSAAQTLYADPSSAAPWADRAVMVGRVPASDTDGSFRYGEGSKVRIQGTDGRVGNDGAMRFAAWPLVSDCDVCDQEAFVVGYGLTQAEVVDIAESVSQEPTPHADPATLPAGLEPLGSAPGSEGWVVTDPSAQEFVLRAGTTEATVQVWSGDPRLHAHLAFWSLDRPEAPTERDGWSTVADRGENVVVLTTTSMPSAAEATAFRSAVRALVPGDDRAVDDALAQTIADLQPLDSTQNLCWTDDGPWETFSGVVEDTTWGVTLMVQGKYFSSCDYVRTADATHDSRGEGGGALGPIGPDGVRLGGGILIGSGEGRWTQIVSGDVPATATRVRVETGGKTADATMGTLGPTADRRWFATAFLLEDLVSGDQRLEVTAFDASGTIVATATTG